jgi:membrane protease subunit HflC
MNQKHLTIILVILGAAVVLLYKSAFIVTQTQQSLVLQFGDIKRVEKEPGLKFMIPFVQNVLFFDNRLLDFNAEPKEFITEFVTSDTKQKVQERVVIDAFVRYRITDPVRFYQSVKNEFNLRSRLNSILNATIRRVVGKHSLNDLLSDERIEIMRDIKNAVNAQVSGKTALLTDSDSENRTTNQESVQGFGIVVEDVRILRADLPEEISESTFNRMRTNFSKEAQKFRAEGEEKALEIRSNADRERVELIAQARKTAEILRGEGDGTAAKIYADAFNRDKAFFEFYRSMQAYRATLNQKDTTAVLSPDSNFLKFINKE